MYRLTLQTYYLLNCLWISYIVLFISFSLSKLKDSRATVLAYVCLPIFKLHIIYFVWATELQCYFVFVWCLIYTELFLWFISLMWFPGIWDTSLLNTDHGIKRLLTDIRYVYFWIYIFLWFSMDFYGPAWSAKYSSDFLASGNKASTGGRAPSFCSSLSYVRHFVMVWKSANRIFFWLWNPM